MRRTDSRWRKKGRKVVHGNAGAGGRGDTKDGGRERRDVRRMRMMGSRGSDRVGSEHGESEFDKREGERKRRDDLLQPRWL